METPALSLQNTAVQKAVAQKTVAQNPAAQTPDRAARDAQLREQAREFEAVFVSQMLKHAGLTEALSGSESKFGGEAFSNMLTEQYANELVEDGGFGLAEEIYQQLLEKDKSHGSGNAY